MDTSISYYEDLTRISNSNIGWFLNKGPAFLHKMLIDPPPEEKNSTLERGTMIHEYLLQPEEFQKDYVVWDKRRPSSAQQEKFCQELANSAEIEPNKAVLSAYQASYSTTNRSEEKMLSEGLKIASELKEYIDFLKSNDSRKMIGPWDVKMLEKIKNNFKKHKLAWNLLKPYGIVYKGVLTESGIEKTDDIEFERHHEFHINWEHETLSNGVIRCKSLLDSLTIDYTDKIITIMDLKTTAKLWHFEDSMINYDYLRQLMYYKMAVEWYMLNEKNIDTKDGWTFKFYIIGIDTVEDYSIRVFEVHFTNVNEREYTIIHALDEIAWHQSTGKWDHTRAYYEGDGSETLNL